MIRTFLISLVIFLPLFCFGQKFTVQPFSLKASYDVFSPVFYQDGIIVCSNKKKTIYSTVIDESEKEPVNLFHIKIKDSSQLNYFDETFHSTFNDGPITFNGHFTKTVISKNITSPKLRKLDKENYSVLGLYFSENKNGKWNELKSFPFNDSINTYTHPTLSQDGKVLIFSSNRPGGHGGYDLWMSIYDKNWSEPINLGTSVNSEFDEVFPTLNGLTLIFSSNRDDGYGKLDLYSINSITKNNLFHFPEPVNSAADDFGVITKDYLRTGFFSTNRNGEDQIFKLNYIFPEFDCSPQVQDEFCYTLYEENAISLEIQSLKYHWSINNISLFGVAVDYCFEEEGIYHVNLDIIDTVLKETYYNQAEYEVLIEYTQQAFISCPDTIMTNKATLFSAEKSNLPGVEIENYYWEIKNGPRAMGKEISFALSEEGVYEVTLGIVGKLGVQEVSYCSTKEIVVLNNKEQVFVYKNLIPAQLEDSSIVKDAIFYNVPSSDTSIRFSIYIPILANADAQRKKAIESILAQYHESEIALLKEDSTVSYLIGNTKNINDLYESWAELIKNKLTDVIVKSYNPSYDSLKIIFGKNFVLEDVQFDSDKYELRESAMLKLQMVLKDMKDFPEIKLDISGHTDNTSDDAHNLELSKNRVISITNYLIEKGIEKNRIQYYYFGESKPITSNDTEEGKQKNRRVEFKYKLK